MTMKESVVGKDSSNLTNLTASGEYRKEDNYRDNVKEGGTGNDECAAAAEDGARQNCCYAYIGFDGVTEARGLAIMFATRGVLVMSNIFLSVSFVYLASLDAGCVNFGPDFDVDPRNFTYVEPCPNSVYGFKPGSLVANIAVITGLLSAFLMPLIGAVVDYTPHRRAVGIWSAVWIVAIQIIQIGTVESTWFPMLILQGIAGFMYQIQVVAAFAYLPEVASLVGQEKMASYTAKFTTFPFLAQALFLVIVTAVSKGFGWNDVVTAVFSQAINSPWIGIMFFFGWRTVPNRCARRERQRGKSLCGEGTRQIIRTTKNIFKHYPRGLLWYFLAVIFAEASTNALTTVSVIFMANHLELSGASIGIVFFVSLISSVPGCFVSQIFSNRANPKISWIWCLVVYSIVTLLASLILAGPDQAHWIYLFGGLWGFSIGWFYSSENLIFSMILPKGQEAELSGFFVYMTQILVWLPPMAFALLIQAGVSQRWGVLVVCIFAFIALVMLLFMAPWDKVLEESSHVSVRIDCPSDAYETTINDGNETTTNDSSENGKIKAAINEFDVETRGKQEANSVQESILT